MCRRRPAVTSCPPATDLCVTGCGPRPPTPAPFARAHPGKMTVYDDVEIEDMSWDAELLAYTYQCPCGDVFQITKDELRDGEEIAHCPSCTLVVRVIYDPDDFADDGADDGSARVPVVRCVEVDA